MTTGNTVAHVRIMKTSPTSRCSTRTLANLGVATAEIDFVPNGHFSYRHNADGSMDSICLSCYLTAATGFTSDELMQQELLHLGECLGKRYVHRVRSTFYEAVRAR